MLELIRKVLIVCDFKKRLASTIVVNGDRSKSRALTTGGCQKFWQGTIKR